MFVRTKKKVTQYDGVSRVKSLEQEDKLKKDMTPEQMRDKLKLVLGEAGTEQHDITDLSELFNATKNAMASASGGSSAFDGHGILSPDVGEMIAQSRSKAKKGGKDDQEEDNVDEEAEDEEDNDDDTEPAPGKPSLKPSPKKGTGTKDVGEKADGWIDETKCRKAERSYLGAVETLKESLEATLSEMRDVLCKFRKNPEVAKVVAP